ncbi:MAG TPA: hypothetical protein VH482_07295 [Thermomicrobiales bacterium]
MTGSADRSRSASTADLILQITPEPTDDERDALLAALTILLTEPVAAISAVRAQVTPSRWARAGREAAIEAHRFRRGWRLS